MVYERKRETDKPMADKRDGVVRDPVNWQGQVVSYVKDIGNGDPGYDANVRQVLITLADGTEKVVPEAEILRNKPPAGEATETDRRPDETLPVDHPGNLTGAGSRTLPGNEKN
jgi:hypothetical protein